MSDGLDELSTTSLGRGAMEVFSGTAVGETGIIAMIRDDGLVIGLIYADGKPGPFSRLERRTTLDIWAGYIEDSIRETGNCGRAAERMFDECNFKEKLHPSVCAPVGDVLGET